MKPLLEFNKERRGILPKIFVVGVDYPSTNETTKQQVLDNPQGIDMASTIHSFLELMPEYPMEGISGNIPKDILKTIPSTGRTMWVFLNRILPDTSLNRLKNMPEFLYFGQTKQQALRELPEKVRKEQEEIIANKDLFKTGLIWVEGGIKLEKPIEEWIKQVKPENFKNHKNRPYWIGWTKMLSDYTVGAKIVYFPPLLVKKLYDLRNAGKLRLQHMDRFVKSLDPIMGQAITVNRSKIPKLLMYCLFNKKSNYGTKHNKALKCDDPTPNYKINLGTGQFVFIGENKKDDKKIPLKRVKVGGDYIYKIKKKRKA